MGNLIVIEGVDSSGKETQSNLLLERLLSLPGKDPQPNVVKAIGRTMSAHMLLLYSLPATVMRPIKPSGRRIICREGLCWLTGTPPQI